MNNKHLNVYCDLLGVVLTDLDDRAAVLMSFTDRETGVTDHYPVPPETAINIGNELIRIANILKEREES